MTVVIAVIGAKALYLLFVLAGLGHRRLVPVGPQGLRRAAGPRARG